MAWFFKINLNLVDAEEVDQQWVKLSSGHRSSNGTNTKENETKVDD